MSAAASVVGVRYFPASKTHTPLRIFYPAAGTPKLTDNRDGKTARHQQKRPVKWFQDTGIIPYLSGYFHLTLAKHDSWTFALILRPLIYVLSWILPMTHLKIPNAYQNLDCFAVTDKSNRGVNTEGSNLSVNDSYCNSRKLPVIIFSHGLTGTGQENSALATHWAQQGYVVVVVHHTDGSSCRVQLADGSVKYYESASFTNYDTQFRPRQVNIRALEVLQAYRFLVPSTKSADFDKENDLGECANNLNLDCCLRDLQEAVDPNNAVVAGFSYGAATAARVAVMDESPFRAALFLDGWFYIDISNVEFRFPEEAFAKGLPPSLPALFLVSQQFQNYPKLYAATLQLAKINNTEVASSMNTINQIPKSRPVVVLPYTAHQNFCDVIFWLPKWLLKRLLKGTIGEADPIISFQDIAERTIDFLDSVTKGKVDLERKKI